MIDDKREKAYEAMTTFTHKVFEAASSELQFVLLVHHPDSGGITQSISQGVSADDSLRKPFRVAVGLEDP